MNDKLKKIHLEFYNELTGQSLEELPSHSSTILKQIKKTDLCRPLVLRDRANGLTIGKLVIKYNLSERQVKYILFNKSSLLI